MRSSRYFSQIKIWRRNSSRFIGNSNIEFTEKYVLEIKIAEKFVGERGRINCSLKEKDGFWRWLGIQYVISQR